MTPEDRARVIVKQFQEDGHPYYDELVEMIAAAIEQAVADELKSMAVAFEKSAAADWPDGGRASRRRRGQQDAFDDGLLTATGRLRCRAAAVRSQKEAVP